MKNKRILFLLVALCCVLGMQAEDLTKIALKGRVLKTVVTDDAQNLKSVAVFSSEGNLVNIELQDETTDYGYELGLAIYRKNYVTEMTNGKISHLQFTDSYDKRCTISFYYGQNGQLSKMTYVENWITTSVEHISASAQMNEAVTKAKRLKSELAKLKAGTPAYNQKMAEYQAAAKKASVNNFGAQNIEHVQTHTSEGETKSFSNYEFDEFGNWTKRKVSVDGRTSYWEYQSVTYEPNFYCTYQWTKIEKSGNLDEVAAFYENTKTTEGFKLKARNYWNSRIIEEVFKKCGNQLGCLVRTASSSICSYENREKIMDKVRQQVYQQRVVNERDYKTLKNLAFMKIDNVTVFNRAYQDKIVQRSEKMFNDSVAYLRNKIDGHLAAKEYVCAHNTALQAQKVSPVFSKQIAEAEYHLLMIDKDNKTITSADCERYRKDNPGSIYDEEIAELQEKLYVRENRGRFVHYGVGGNFSIGKGMYEASGGIDVVLGWHCSLLNFYTGVHYGGFGVLYSGNTNRDASIQSNGGHFSGQHVTIPAVLRFNLKRSFTENYYIGLGANLNVVTAGYLGYTDSNGDALHLKNKEFYKKPFFITPRISVGYSMNMLELEVYGLYEIGDVLNEGLINDMMTAYPDYKFNTEQLNSQIKHRFRGGVSIRYLF